MCATVTWVTLIGGSLLPPLIGWWRYPLLTRELLRDLRLPRILHFVALGGLGMALTAKETGQGVAVLTLEWGLAMGWMVVALTYAAVFAIVTNNVEDVEADRISNPNRPLVQGTVDAVLYLRAGWFCLAWGILLAFGPMLSIPCTVTDCTAPLALPACIVLISAGYYLYSCKPFRLKRLPFVAKLIIGINSWVVALCGYGLTGSPVMKFPWEWTVFILVPLSLAANFIDLKDVEGDRATGVATLPILFGVRRARGLIAAATLATYIMATALLARAWVYPLTAIAALTHVYLLYRKPYDERWIFLVYVGALFGLDLFLLWL